MRREPRVALGCGARTLFGDRLRGATNVQDMAATLVRHRDIHLFYEILGAFEVGIVICLHLWTREVEIYATARVDQPIEHRLLQI